MAVNAHDPDEKYILFGYNCGDVNLTEGLCKAMAT